MQENRGCQECPMCNWGRTFSAAASSCNIALLGQTLLEERHIFSRPPARRGEVPVGETTPQLQLALGGHGEPKLRRLRASGLDP